MNKLLLITLCFVLSSICSAQLPEQTRYIEPPSLSIIDSIDTHYNLKHPLPESCMEAIYSTLLYFPELKGSKIKFNEKTLKTTMNARPSFGSLLFKKRSNRNYRVNINTGNRDSTINIESVDFNAQVGVLGHEFCHFIDYNQRSFFGVVGRLFDYTSKKRKKQFEQEIDLKTIERGLGWQLYDWTYYVLNEAEINSKYRKLKEEVYLKPADIKAIINE